MRDAKNQKAPLDLIAETANAIASGEPFREALPRICSSFVTDTGASYVRIVLRDERSERVLCEQPPSPVAVKDERVLPLSYASQTLGHVAFARPQPFTDSEAAIVTGWSAMVALYLHQSSIEAENRRLELLAQSDQVTGVPNRRAFDVALQRAWHAASERNAPVSLIVADIDYFKEYNDRYGHLAGDAALRRTAAVVAGAAERSGEIGARFGGEEFALLLPGCEEPDAIALAERVRARVDALHIDHAGSQLGHLSISAGVATMHASARVAASTLISRADAALYRAKTCGRNRVASDRYVSQTAPLRRSNAHLERVRIPDTQAIAREELAKRLLDAIDRSRLVTLVGGEGSGKTRLATELIGAPGAFSDGVWYASLRECESHDDVVATLSRLLPMAPNRAASTHEAVLDYLQDARGLLVLDDVGRASALDPFVDSLLRRAANLHVLVLAPAALGIVGESTISLPPLSEAEAARLAAARGATGTVAARIPLAVELAVPVGDAAREAASVDDAARIALGAVHAGSRSVLEALAVFQPGVSEETARRASGAQDGQLDELCRRALVQRYRNDRRIGIPSAVARAVLANLAAGDRTTLLRRHYSCYLELARARDVGELIADEDNVTAALRFASTLPEAEPLAQLAATLQPLWLTGSRLTEGLHWLELALRRAPRPAEASEIFANAWRTAGILSRRRSDYLRAAKYNERALLAWRALGNDKGIASALNGLALVAQYTGDFERARRSYEESLALATSSGDDEAVAMAHNNLAGLAMFRGDYGEADVQFRVAAQSAAEPAHANLGALVNNNIAELRFLQGQFEDAERFAQRSLDVRLKARETPALAATWLNLANIRISRGDITGAWRAVRESLLLYRSTDDARGIATAINATARLLAAAHHPQEAARMVSNADALLERAGARLYGSELVVREMLGELVDGALQLREPAGRLDEAFEEALAALNLSL